jgi:hypothetical protein
MSITDANHLKPGDEVFWNDPDDGDGDCSRKIVIASIKRRVPGVYSIVDKSGDHVECYARELK